LAGIVESGRKEQRMNFVETNIFADRSPSALGLYDSTSSRAGSAFQRDPRVSCTAHAARLGWARALIQLVLLFTGVLASAILTFVLVASLHALVHPGLRAQSVAAPVRSPDRVNDRTVLPAKDTAASPASALPPSTPRIGSANWVPAVLGTQVNLITQHLARSTAAYLGPNSLDPNGDTQTSQAYGVYAGASITRRLAGYLDVEMIRGGGINHATGLAGITNGDVLRQGSVDLGSGPYVAKAFLKYTVPFATEASDTLQRAQDQVPTIVASRRVEVVAGKGAASDLFDVNRYANTTRQQFMNWGLFQNTAWDFAADTRGYSNGVAVSWITPAYAIRVGSFQMPTLANGNKFDPDLRRGRGDHVELTVNVPRSGTIVRTLAWVNHARMGSYQLALDRAAAARASGGADTIPDVVATDAPGRRKYGFGLNLEQPVADDGETGLFARVGWSDGANESFAFTEVDRHLSAGGQISGAHWGRAADRLAVAIVQHSIVSVHQRYLAAGGVGFLLGDGALTYGPEQVVESFYRAQIGDYVQLGPDVQLIRNPGYNRDHGLATILGFRFNLRY